MDDVFATLTHGRLDFVPQLLALILQGLLAHLERLDSLVHRMQFVQVTHRELVQANLRPFFDECPEVFFRVFALLNLSLQHFLQLVYFVQCVCIAFAVPLSLFLSFEFDLLLDGHVVVFEAAHCCVQLDRALLGRLLRRVHQCRGQILVN